MNQKPYESAEHEFEAALGLPEPLPAGETILWQGVPSWTAMARSLFCSDCGFAGLFSGG